MTPSRRFPAVILATVAVLLGAASPAIAAESIPLVEVSAEVLADTSVQVTERIVYDFADTPDRHGIYRDLVLQDEDTLGRIRSYDVNVTSVTVDGLDAPVELIDDQSTLRVRIGDPGITVTGRHEYVISYVITGALRTVTAADAADAQAPSGLSTGDVEWYWDLVANTFGVPITEARATVTGPAPPIAARCLTGTFGQGQGCPAAIEAGTVLLGPVPLADGQILTTAIDYPASAFTAPVVENITEAPSRALPLAIAALLGLLLALVPPLLALLWRRSDRGVNMAGSPVQFEPPDGLRAAPMAAAWQGNEAARRPRVLVATLTDLAARGHLTITDAEHLTVRRAAGNDADLANWEADLLDVMFARSSAVTLDEYDEVLAEQWQEVMAQLEQDAQSAGRRNPAGGAPDRRWNWLLAPIALAAIAFVIGILTGMVELIIIAIGVGGGAAIGLVLARIITPRRETVQSATFQAKVRGFERLLGTDAAAARREFAQRLGLPAGAILATLLPYAIVFDLESSWIGAFPDLTPEELRTTGLAFGSVAALGSMVDHATQSASSALTAPSSGSGSGGSAGGGGGGGGGGAW